MGYGADEEETIGMTAYLPWQGNEMDVKCFMKSAFVLVMFCEMLIAMHIRVIHTIIQRNISRKNIVS